MRVTGGGGQERVNQGCGVKHRTGEIYVACTVFAVPDRARIDPSLADRLTGGLHVYSTMVSRRRHAAALLVLHSDAS